MLSIIQTLYEQDPFEMLSDEEKRKVIDRIEGKIKKRKAKRLGTQKMHGEKEEYTD